MNPVLLVSGVTCLAHLQKCTCAYSDRTHKCAEAQCRGYCNVLSVTYLSTPAWVFSNDQCTHSATAYKLKS